MARTIRLFLITLAAACLAGCVSIVSPYDSYYDQSLNKLSEDTAKFLAAAQQGRPERIANSAEAVAYYASTYNLLDRLSQRARQSRGAVACPNDAALVDYCRRPVVKTPLPADYLSFDCREFQLYALRFFVDQLGYGQASGGVLTPLEARALGAPLQTAIIGAIQTFIVTKS